MGADRLIGPLEGTAPRREPSLTAQVPLISSRPRAPLRAGTAGVRVPPRIRAGGRGPSRFRWRTGCGTSGETYCIYENDPIMHSGKEALCSPAGRAGRRKDTDETLGSALVWELQTRGRAERSPRRGEAPPRSPECRSQTRSRCRGRGSSGEGCRPPGWGVLAVAVTLPTLLPAR